MKNTLLGVALTCCSSIVNAQITKVDELKKSLESSNKDTVAWVHSGVLTIGTNGGFLHNWAAGGELGSLLINGIFNGRLDRLMG
jgi:hypothetical protein